ncbi:hypothetical protein Tsubulata_041242 [Turnera subulata]|uniref:Large proline-rich protein BAG6 domain-containing protein n=1 Tax=Turnera subulata TaxID=218843 RepID=A0A9Q0J6R5_9ROSI|nr:hypothetical protein Tsubulata_041242 [Turnera subulata]
MVLGTFNVGDPGEGTAADLSRVIGAVLNSFGIGGQAGANGLGGMQPSFSTMYPSQAAQGHEQGSANVNGQSQAGNQPSSAQAFAGQPFQVRPQVMQVPISASVPVPLPTLHSPIPDSLSTLSEFMTRMERALAQHGLQPNASSNNLGDLPRVELPSNARGLRTPEALSIVMRQAEQLLSGPTITALSHIAGRLEQQGASTDLDTRGQIQMESVHLGVAMQHLGALLLELGRTILMLRMGPSPGEASVNTGPAVYISSSGPNPIMVQPFPLQTNSLFGNSVSPPTPVPLPIGTTSRNINIHIHAGTTLAPAVSTVGTRASGEEGMQGEPGNSTNSGGSGPDWMQTVRNIIATAVPSRSAGGTVSNAMQPGPGGAVSQPQSDSASVSSMVDEINSMIRSLGVGRGGENQPASGSLGSSAGIVSDGEQLNRMMTNDSGESSVALVDEINSHLRSLLDNSREENQPASGSVRSAATSDRGSELNSMSRHDVGEPTVALPGLISESDGYKTQDECVQLSNNEAKKNLLSSEDVSSSSVGCSSGETSLKSDTSETQNSSEKKDVSEGSKAVPLGLGLGNLERKRRTKPQQPKSLARSGETGSTPFDQNQNTGMNTQQLLQSIASGSASANSAGPNNVPLSLALPVGGLDADNRPVEVPSSDGQFDVASAMSQVLQSPAMNGLLGGVADRAGVGSPNVLTNMLQQLMQNPQIMNTVGQIAQQVDTRDVGNMLSGSGNGQSGGIDLSRMFQQMMPVVSQVLGAGSATPFPLPNVQAEPHLEHDERRSIQAERPDEHGTQIDLRGVAQRIEHFDSAGDVFQSVIDSAVRMNGSENIPDVFRDLREDEDLANEYMQMLTSDLCQRAGNSRQD